MQNEDQEWATFPMFPTKKNSISKSNYNLAENGELLFILVNRFFIL